MAFAPIYVLLLLGPIEVLLPFAVRDQTGAGPAGFSLVLVCFGVGGAIGSLVTASLRLPRRYLTTMMLVWGLGALPLAVIGLTDRLLLMAAATLTVGYAWRLPADEIAHPLDEQVGDLLADPAAPLRAP